MLEIGGRQRHRGSDVVFDLDLETWDEIGPEFVEQPVAFWVETNANVRSRDVLILVEQSCTFSSVDYLD